MNLKKIEKISNSNKIVKKKFCSIPFFLTLFEFYKCSGQFNFLKKQVQEVKSADLNLEITKL
jgi:hypothetical protein